MSQLITFFVITCLIITPTAHAYTDADDFTVFMDVVGTSTPSTTPTTTPNPQGGGGASTPQGDVALKFDLENFSATDSKVLLKWSTNLETKWKIDWGKTTDYELGSASSIRFSEKGNKEIDSLAPSTRYYVRLTLEAKDGETLIKTFSITTRASDSEASEGEAEIANPVRFKGVRTGNDAILSWFLPTDEAKEVRIVKSDLFYPVDPMDGEVVFEGSSDGLYLDEDVSQEGIYYAIFAKQGNRYSSGVVTYIGAESIFPGDQEAPPIEIDTTSPQLEISLTDIVFFQGGEVIGFLANDFVAVDASEPLVIWLPSSALPKSLKSIVVTVSDPRGGKGSFRFLLRLNADRTAYVGRLAPLGAIGESNITIDVLNFSNRSRAHLTGSISLYTSDPSLTAHQGSDQDKGNPYRFLSYILIAIILALVIRIKFFLHP